jgi:thymidylate synthase
MGRTKEQEQNPQVINHADRQYHELLRDILQNGRESPDRTGTGTLKVFGKTLNFDLAEGFPLLTTKRVWFHGVKEELLWFIRGERNIRPLVLKGVNIWNEWPFKRYLEAKGLDQIHPATTPEEWETRLDDFVKRVKEDEDFSLQWGDLGPVYGYQWRHWRTPEGKEIDQLADAIDLIKNKPESRRIIVSAWNPGDLEDVALPPCHMSYQFQVDGDKLNCMMYQRSVDTFLGLPFNIASYALLTETIAKITDKKPGNLTLALGDTHLYLNHLEKVETQLARDPLPLPKLLLEPSINDIDDIPSEAITISGYDPHPAIKAPISV